MPRDTLTTVTVLAFSTKLSVTSHSPIVQLCPGQSHCSREALSWALQREAHRWLASSQERHGFSLEHPRAMPPQWDMLSAWVLLTISFCIFWEEKHPQLFEK